jgi:hydrogenase maturation factor
VSGHCDRNESCVTCGDVATPVRVLSVDDASLLAVCAGDDGVRASIDTTLVAPVAAGDVLLAHAGCAIARVTTEARG